MVDIIAIKKPLAHTMQKYFSSISSSGSSGSSSSDASSDVGNDDGWYNDNDVTLSSATPQ